VPDEEFGILVLRAVIAVGLEDELGVRQVLLQDERVHGVDDHVHCRRSRTSAAGESPSDNSNGFSRGAPHLG